MNLNNVRSYFNKIQFVIFLDQINISKKKDCGNGKPFMKMTQRFGGQREDYDQVTLFFKLN